MISNIDFCYSTEKYFRLKRASTIEANFSKESDSQMSELNSHSRRWFLSSIIPAAATLELGSVATAQNHSSRAVEGPSGDRRKGIANWMRKAQWGVMTHYLADWIAKDTDKEMTVARWNDLVDHFDVEGLADQIKSTGAGYHLISIGQNSGYYLSPNATYDRIVGIRPSKCSKRDLIANLYDAHHRRGVKLMVYLPSGAPEGDAVAVKALGWQTGAHRNNEFQIKWQQVIREWSERWGKKVSGWWFDGCYWPNTMYRMSAPNFASFAAAARAGNQESAVAFNPGVFHRILSMSPYEDYTAGEIDLPEKIMVTHAEDGIVDGAQLHILSHLGERWGMGSPRFSADQIVAWGRKLKNQGGAFTWDTPVRTDGHISQVFIDQLTAIGHDSDTA